MVLDLRGLNLREDNANGAVISHLALDAVRRLNLARRVQTELSTMILEHDPAIELVVLVLSDGHTQLVKLQLVEAPEPAVQLSA